MFKNTIPAIEPNQVFMSINEVNIFLVEDGCPLEGGACGLGLFVSMDRAKCREDCFGSGERKERNGGVFNTMKSLARGTMAELRTERFFPTDFVLDSTAVTTSLAIQCNYQQVPSQGIRGREDIRETYYKPLKPSF